MKISRLLARLSGDRYPNEMRAPPHAAITIALDTAKYRARRPEERERHIFYLLDRLLAGEVVADDALEHYGLKVTIREALSPEILKEEG